jgi:hypothetical protein
VLNEELSLKYKENSTPTKTHEAESVRTLGSSPELLLIAIKSFPKILLSDCGVLGNRVLFAVKSLKRIRWEGVERFIWLRIGPSGGPFYTRQQLMNFGFYKIQEISRLALQLAASEEGLPSSELVIDEFTCSFKNYLTIMKLTSPHLKLSAFITFPAYWEKKLVSYFLKKSRFIT